jgi:hypothetical protein
LNGSEDQKDALVACPSGDVATGGGYALVGALGKIAAVEDRADTLNGKPLGWFVVAHEVVPTDSEWYISIYTYCAPAS